MDLLKNGVAEGALITVLCAITGALGYLTAQKVDDVRAAREKHYTTV